MTEDPCEPRPSSTNALERYLRAHLEDPDGLGTGEVRNDDVLHDVVLVSERLLLNQVVPAVRRDFPPMRDDFQCPDKTVW